MSTMEIHQAFRWYSCMEQATPGVLLNGSWINCLMPFTPLRWRKVATVMPVALRFALDYPARTPGLLLASPRAEKRNRPGMQELWETTISKLADPIHPDFVHRLTVLAQPVPQSFLDVMAQENLKVPASVRKALFLGGMQEDFSNDFDRIYARTMLIWGGWDASISPGEQEMLVTAIPGSERLIYPHAGHMLHWEEPEHFAADLAAFIHRPGY